MASIRTHYDNLKIARDAPPEVIRAAYRALSQRFHPDRNPGDTRAANIMLLINTSFETLSDPAKRAAHDRWIAEQESAQMRDARSGHEYRSSQAPTETASKQRFRGISLSALVPWLLGTAALLFVFFVQKIPVQGPKPYTQTAPASVVPLSAGPSSIPVRVVAVELGKAVGLDQRITSPATVFNTHDTIYAAISTVGSASNATLSADWTYADNVPVNHSSTKISPFGPAVTSFHISKPDGWPAGPYKVQIWLDDRLVDTRFFGVNVQNSPANQDKAGSFDDLLPQKSSVSQAGSPTSLTSGWQEAPNGKPWPTTASYIRGVPMLSANGLSMLTIDNGNNGSPVFVKLVSLSGKRAYPVRQAFIPAHATFKMKKISPGNYDVRYRDLKTGHLVRSESFDLTQQRVSDGETYSVLTITLYKVANGNFHTFPLAEDEF